MKYLVKLSIISVGAVFISVLAIISPHKIAYCESNPPQLKQGMTFIEVIKLLGSPDEKIEKEIKRKDVWLYKNSKVIFQNGLVDSVFDNKGINILLPANQISQEQDVLKSKPGQSTGTAVASQDVVDDILSEIMKDPSNTDGTDLSGNRSAAQTVPNVINAVPPPPEVIQ